MNQIFNPLSSKLLIFIFIILTITPIIIFRGHPGALFVFPMNYLYFGIVALFVPGADKSFSFLSFLLGICLLTFLFHTLKRFNIEPIWKYMIWGIYLFLLWMGLIFYFMEITWH